MGCLEKLRIKVNIEPLCILINYSFVLLRHVHFVLFCTT